MSLCVAGCFRPCRGDLLPCCTALCWWRRRVQCQGHLSDKQSRCLTLTNSPAGLGQLPVNPPPLHQLTVPRLAAAAAKTLCPYRSLPQPNTQSTPTGHLLLFGCGKLLPLSPAALELHMIVFLVMGKRLLWICSLYLSAQRDHCQKLMETLKLSCLCTVGCGGCNLNWLHKSVERLWFNCFKLKGSIVCLLARFTAVIAHEQNIQRFWLCLIQLSFFHQHVPHMEIVLLL